jgi:hypothetical protein
MAKKETINQELIEKQLWKNRRQTERKFIDLNINNLTLFLTQLAQIGILRKKLHFLKY